MLERNWAPTNQPIEHLLGKLRGEFNEHFIVSILVGPDDKNSSVNILQVNLREMLWTEPQWQFILMYFLFKKIDQLMLALPSREYYMKSNNELTAYHRYMTQIAILLGADPDTAATEMQNVIDFEVSLANVSASRLKFRI